MSMVTIVTPTFDASIERLQRCIDSVLRQTFVDFTHIVCSDGPCEFRAQSVVNGYVDKRLAYHFLEPHRGGYGHEIRQHWISRIESRYTVFLDDDNFIFPEYLSEMILALVRTQARFAVCGILHYGPVPANLGRPPVILPGEPRIGHIDTLQVMAETSLLREVGWQGVDYVADGRTYEALAQRAPWTRIPQVLCVHS